MEQEPRTRSRCILLSMPWGKDSHFQPQIKAGAAQGKVLEIYAAGQAESGQEVHFSRFFIPFDDFNKLFLAIFIDLLYLCD